MGAILKRELNNYFNTFSGYAFLGFFVLITGYFFVGQNVEAYSGNYNDVLIASMIMFLILVPVLTMRLFAEDSRQKTDQLLYTSPVSVTGIVMGKFFAAVILFLIGLLITMLFPFMLSRYGSIDTGVIAGCVFGYFLMGACLISVGLFISVLTDNQIVAAAGTFAVLFLLLMIDNIAMSAPISRQSSVLFAVALAVAVVVIAFSSSKSIPVAIIFAIVGAVIIALTYALVPAIYDGLIYNVLGWISVLSRFENFYLGSFGISDIVYYITFMFAFLYLTANVIEKRRWN